MMNKLKVLFCLVVVVIGGSFATAKAVGMVAPSKADVKEWAHYSNEEQGISLEYPASWDYRQMDGGKLTPFGVKFANVNFDLWHAGPGIYPTRLINVAYYTAPGLSVKEYAEGDLKEKGMTSTESQRMIGGKEGLQQEGRLDREGQTYASAYVKQGDYVVIIETAFQESEKEIVMESFDHLLNSVSFSK